MTQLSQDRDSIGQCMCQVGGKGCGDGGFTTSGKRATCWCGGVLCSRPGVLTFRAGALLRLSSACTPSATKQPPSLLPERGPLLVLQWASSPKLVPDALFPGSCGFCATNKTALLHCRLLTCPPLVPAARSPLLQCNQRQPAAPQQPFPDQAGQVCQVRHEWRRGGDLRGAGGHDLPEPVPRVL